MSEEIKRPIKVVMFGGGPELTHDAKEFLYRLEMNPDIEFLGAICQAESQSYRAIFKDLWQRRKWLAFPLFISRIIVGLVRYLENPREETELNQKLKQLSLRIHNVNDIQ